jgi:choline dehydrogenase-like flavoprotein
MSETVDVVVVGGGTAGCIAAARLSADPGRRVLLIEAGPDYATAVPAAVLEGRVVPMRGHAADVDPRHDWGPAAEGPAAHRPRCRSRSCARPTSAGPGRDGAGAMTTTYEGVNHGDRGPPR